MVYKVCQGDDRMILVTERYTDFMVDQNPYARFIYFETEKQDTATDFVSIRDRKNAIPIRYRHNMSDKGLWQDEDYTNKASMAKVDFSNAFENSRASRVVVFPMISFNIILSFLTPKYQKLFENEYAKLLAHNDIRDYRYNNAF